MGTAREYISSHGGWQFDRATKRIGSWIAGYGLLSLNISLFLLTATGLFLYNLYHDPKNIDFLEQLRFWALLVIFHAIAVTVFWILSWTLRAEKSESSGAPRFEPAPPGAIHAIGSGESLGGTRFRPTISTPVLVDELEESEHFWRRRSTAIFHRHEPGRQDTWQWSISDEAELTRTLPEPSVEERPSPVLELDAESQTEDDGIPTVGDTLAGVVYDPVELARDDVDEPEQVDEAKDSVIDPLRVAGRQPDADSSRGDEVLTRWLWVEAAAAAWLAQREDAEIESSGTNVLSSADGADAEAL